VKVTYDKSELTNGLLIHVFTYPTPATWSVEARLRGFSNGLCSIPPKDKGSHDSGSHDSSSSERLLRAKVVR
jgi:hypothetical protein